MALGNNPVMAAQQLKDNMILPYNPVMQVDATQMQSYPAPEQTGAGLNGQVLPPPPSAPGLDYMAQNRLEMARGGLAEGGMLQEGGTVDPVSGNEVPVGSLQEEVRDDIPAQLSEGEFVFPADVVRFIGLEKLMQLRQAAKEGLAKMEAMGQMSNSEEATIDDDAEFESNIDDIIEEVEQEEQ